MRRSTALMRIENEVVESGIANLRVRLRERALDKATMPPRVWMEALERRIMMDATAATLAFDPSFGVGGYARPAARNARLAGYQNLTEAPGGKFYAVTYPQGVDSQLVPEPFDLMRINANGTLDAAFGERGIVHVRWHDTGLLVESVLVQADGKVLVTAQSTPVYRDDVPYYGVPDTILLMRFGAEGTTDRSFGQDGIVALPTPFYGPRVDRTSIRPDGKIDVLDVLQYQEGGSYNPDQLIALTMWKFNGDGSPDDSFAPDGQWISSISARNPSFVNCNIMSTLASLTTLPDGDSIAYIELHSEEMNDVPNTGGDVEVVKFDKYADVVAHYEYRGFAVGPKGAMLGYGSVGVTGLSDGSALAWNGAFGPWNEPTGAMAHIGPDGTEDASFGVAGFAQAVPSGGLEIGVRYAQVQPNGKILVELWNDRWYSSGLERFNADGSRDLTFAGGQAAFFLNAWGGIAGMPYMPDGSGNVLAMSDGSIIMSLIQSGPDSAPSDYFLARVRADGGTPNTFDLQSYGPGLDPSDNGSESGGTSGDTGGSDGSGTDGSNAPSDPTFGFSSKEVRADFAVGSDGGGFFATSPGATAWNPNGKRDVFYGGTGDE